MSKSTIGNPDPLSMVEGLRYMNRRLAGVNSINIKRIAELEKSVSHLLTERSGLALQVKMRPAPQADMVPAEDLAAAQVQARMDLQAMRAERDAALAENAILSRYRLSLSEALAERDDALVERDDAQFAAHKQRELEVINANIMRALSQSRDEALARVARQSNSIWVLADRAKEAEAEAQALRTDAKRYRWLTDDHADADMRAEVRLIAGSMAISGKGYTDAAIDTARKENST